MSQYVTITFSDGLACVSVHPVWENFINQLWNNLRCRPMLRPWSSIDY